MGVFAMKSARNHRSLIARLLGIGLLVNALVCSFHHATHTGLGLLLSKGFCLSSSSDSPSSRLEQPSAILPNTADQPFNCPLCSPLTLDIAFLLCLGWLLLRTHLGIAQLPPERRDKAPPRHAWPCLNPRASPTAPT